MLGTAIHLIVMLATIAETITGVKSFVKWLDAHFGGLLPGDLVYSILDRRLNAGDWSNRRQPDPNFGRFRASDSLRFPPVFCAAA
jgi:hypothetical protein